MISLNQFISQLCYNNIYPDKEFTEGNYSEKIPNDGNLIDNFIQKYKYYTDKYGRISFSIQDFYDPDPMNPEEHTGYKPDNLPTFFTVTWRYRF